MDFHALSRRELQALCKRNAVRANMSNAAMADALRSLPSVDGIDEIARTVPPPLWAMESAEELIGKEHGHGCPLPRGDRAQVKTRKAAAHKREETVLAPETLHLQGSQRTAAGECMARVRVEEVATGKARTRSSSRSKVTIALHHKEEEVPAAVPKEPIVDSSDVANSSTVVSDKGSDDPKAQVVAVVEEEITKGQNDTRRPTANEMEEVPAPAILLQRQRTLAPGEAEAIAMAKKGTRRSTRSKVAAPARKGHKADSCDTTNVSVNKSSDGPKEDEVDSMVEKETVKPHDGGNVTRRVMANKLEEVPAPATSQQIQRKAALDAATPVEAEEGVATKRRRRPRRSKVAIAARNGQKADSSDAVATGSPVLISDQSAGDPMEEQLLVMVEEQVTKPKEGIVEEQEQMSTVHKSASMIAVEDPPTLSLLCKVEAADIPDKTAAADEETNKEDGFTVAG